jgi:hypothetical protein
MGHCTETWSWVISAQPNAEGVPVKAAESTPRQCVLVGPQPTVTPPRLRASVRDQQTGCCAERDGAT